MPSRNSAEYAADISADLFNIYNHYILLNYYNYYILLI